jgi:hypothetical protein
MPQKFNLNALHAAAVRKAANAKINKLVTALSAATPVDTGEARDGWHRVGDTIVNAVDHIEELNHGSSKQAPTNFIEQTLLSEEGVRPNGIIVRSS